VGSKASEFGYLSGLYSMELIVGDAVLSNSFSWKVADVVLRFSDSVPTSGPTKDQYLYAPKPEIKVCIFKLIVFCYRRNCAMQYLS
jgi:oligosaccharyltransferase complex subunit delta (ribophorin II)